MITRTGRIIRMSPQLDSKIREYADQRGTSINAAVVTLIERGLETARNGINLANTQGEAPSNR